MPQLLARERRAQIETPVVLIFAVVAGILVLLVVGWFILRQQGTVESTRNLTHLKGISEAIDAAGSTPNTDRNVTLLGELRMECDSNTPVLWYGREENRPLTGTVVFGSSSMNGVARIRSAPIGEAYRVANAVYIEDASRRPTTVTSTETGPGVGTVSFDDLITYPYFGAALLQGAYASGTSSTYACGLTATLARYRFVNAIQWERMRKVIDGYRAVEGGYPICSDLYDDRWFVTIETALTNGDGTTKTADDLTNGDAQAITSAEVKIQEMNAELIRSSCATVS